MLRSISLLLLVALPTTLWAGDGEAPATLNPAVAGPVVSIPKTIKAESGDLVEVKAESGAELVTWDASPQLRITYPKADPAQKTVYIHSKVAGVYALVASIPNGKETRVAICLVTVGIPEPPEPPKPPGFSDKLQAAFTADGGDVTQAKRLAALYRTAAATTVKDAALTTTVGLLDEMQRAVKLLGLPSGSLAKTARVIADELNNTLSKNVPLTPALRDQIAAACVRIAETLEGLK